MDGVSAALYVDFDNVFSGLRDVDPAAALKFARRPEEWVERLTERHTADGPRRWLVRRCYINSSAVVRLGPDTDQTVEFWTFRGAFQDAGFEVIDCPPFFKGAKNAADIKIVLDVVDAVAAPTRYDEFVIASGDSDFTPLLARLRAHDRRTTLLAVKGAAALAAVSDRFVSGAELFNILGFSAPTATPPDVTRSAVATPVNNGTPIDPVWAVFEREAGKVLKNAQEPIALSVMGTTLRQKLQGVPKARPWFGHASLSKALDALDLPNMKRSTSHVWDTQRHRAPAAKKSAR